MIVWKLLRGALVVALAAVACYLAAALALGFITVNDGFTETPGGIPVAVCSNGVHTDFVLPVKTDVVDWSTLFPHAAFPADVRGYQSVGIGWGDLDFYRSTPSWSDFSIVTAMRAVAGLGPAALHVQYRPAPGPAERCVELAVDAARYSLLADYIVGSLQVGIGPVAAGYGSTDAFFPAFGRFSAFKSCNVWVGEGLQAAGLPTALWTPFAFQVLQPLKRAARVDP